MEDCKLCIHKPVCDLWRSNECQNASCFSSTEDGCDFFLEERRWIPVTERLPDVGIEVLIYSEDDGVCVDYYGGDSFGYYEVTHWMPLPEPPKEDDNAKMQ